MCVCSLAGGTDVMYNKFNISASSPPDSDSDYSCAVVMSSGQWRISRCHDRHRVVCQSDHLLPGIALHCSINSLTVLHKLHLSEFSSVHNSKF